MKKKTLLFVTLFTCTLCQTTIAQFLNINELMNLRELSPPKQELFILNKGFLKYKSDNDSKSFKFGNSKIWLTLIREIFKKQIIVYVFPSTNEKYYSDLLNNLETANLEYVGEENNLSFQGFRYRKPHIDSSKNLDVLIGKMKFNNIENSNIIIVGSTLGISSYYHF